MSYKDTLNLPQTDFPIKANSAKKEPELLEFWQDQGTYEKLKIKKFKKYTLHDGPPYPNGDIHLGHALNKILKDIVVKYKFMCGFCAPVFFGWDCHGLPIETQLLKNLGIKRQEIDILEFRKKCREYALKYVDLQRTEFKRLGIFGEWDKPYLTLNYKYEEKVIELFGKLAEEGYVYKGLKPIHWCPDCETALAEAEIEYADEKSHSIYVKFGLSPEPRRNEFFIIWTTTPWTLPANVALAVHPDYEYLKVKVGNEIYVLAAGLLENFLLKLEIKNHEVLEKIKGKELAGLVCKHPFMGREVKVVNAKLVTLEQGTGCVHLAPGHGQEDYQVGLESKLPILMPVDEKGIFTAEAGKYKGLRYNKANQIIIDDLKKAGTLLFDETISHSYPHCWRCKKPVIFRATQQWFISVNHKHLRQKALEAIKGTSWYPAWGESRLAGMVESRPDWCISRQRSWGVPIPAFYCQACGQPNLSGRFNQAVRDLIRAEGSDGWFRKSAAEILPPDLKCQHCAQAAGFKKETDILDVWFESGASHYAVLDGNPEFNWPADLYLEGSDQHRGWFQTSLLTSVALKGRAPYISVLTHGFTVDESGKKMSKSLGNVVDPQSVVKESGADILRLWVASADFRSDISASKNILIQIRDAYSKIRNTCRFLLSNLNDFKEKVEFAQLAEIDRWILLKLNKLIEKVKKACDNFEFHIVFHALHAFCVNDLSALYLDVIKDRLYCDAKNSVSRRSAQTVCRQMLDSLVKLIAPVLSFTAEEIYQILNSQSLILNSIFFESMPDSKKEYENQDLEEKWERLLSIRETVYLALETARAEKKVKSFTEAEVEICASAPTLKFLGENINILASLFIVAQVKLLEGAAAEVKVAVNKSAHPKCERCWIHYESVGKDEKHPSLCGRCATVVADIGGGRVL